MTTSITTPTVTIRELRRAENEVNDLTWRIERHRGAYLEARIIWQRSWLHRKRTPLVFTAVFATLLAIAVHFATNQGWGNDTTPYVVFAGFLTLCSLIAVREVGSRDEATRTARSERRTLHELRAKLPTATARRDWAARWHELVSSTTPEQMAAGGIVVLDK